MSQLCRVTIQLQDHQRYQDSLEISYELALKDRYRDDQKEVAVRAQKLLRKEAVEFKKQVWLGPTFIGNKPEKRTYNSVVDRVIEHDDYRDLFIDMFSHDLEVARKAFYKLQEIKEKSALEVAFETMDLGDLYVDVDQLLNWSSSHDSQYRF
jgi:hypothetical protein